MFDLIIRHANLPDGQTDVDIACADGKIVEVSPQISEEANEEVVVTGRLVIPPFVDSHFHMDSTLTYGRPRVNASGTLLEGIALWGELKPTLTARTSNAELIFFVVGRSLKAIWLYAPMSTSVTRH